MTHSAPGPAHSFPRFSYKLAISDSPWPFAFQVVGIKTQGDCSMRMDPWNRQTLFVCADAGQGLEGRRVGGG